jgi:hypothetical protein
VADDADLEALGHGGQPLGMGGGLGGADRRRRGVVEWAADPEQRRGAVAQLGLEEAAEVGEGAGGADTQRDHQEDGAGHGEASASGHSVLLLLWAFRSAERA